MIFAGLLAALPGFLLKFIGSGTLETVLSHQRAKLDSDNERERIDAGREVKRLENEQDRRKRIAELQALEYQHGWLWFPKFLIMLSVAVYICARFSVLTWGLDDFGVAVKPLDAWLEYVAGGVVAYLFFKP